MQEEAILIEKAKNDINARNSLILKNIKLIYKIASYFDVNQREDLINEGVFGFIEAIKKYKVQYKCKFSTYAFYWIRLYMQKYQRHQGYKITLVSLEEFNEAALTKKSGASADIESIVIKKEEMQIVNSVLHTLSEKERRVIILRFGIGLEEPHSLQEVGNIIGLSKQRIKQIQDKVLIRSRNILQKEF